MNNSLTGLSGGGEGGLLQKESSQERGLGDTSSVRGLLIRLDLWNVI